jgi:hypothetical protein
MSPGRRSLDVLFGLFLGTGITVGAYVLWALANWIRPQGERAFGMLYVGELSFVPAVLAWAIGGMFLLRHSKHRDIRLGVALTTAHLLWWRLVLAIGTSGKGPAGKWPTILVTGVEPGLYAVSITALAARWFWPRRGVSSDQVRKERAAWTS